MGWYEIIKIKRSKNKVAVLKALNQQVMTATELAKKLNNHRSTISQNLIKLSKDGYVKCLTPKNPNYRPYQITKKGRKILKKIS